MQRRLHWTVFSMILLFPAFGFAQDTIKTEVGMGMSDQKYLEVQSQFQQGLPNLLEKIKDTGTFVEKRQWGEGAASIQQAKKELDIEESVLNKESQYKEIADYVDRIESALDKADGAIQKRGRQSALAQLAEAYKWSKALSESPVLNLARAQIALGQASRLIGQGSYQGAGLYLQQAIDAITAVQKNPALNTEDLNSLKNQIIITQNQVVLGKLKDEKKLKNFYPGLAAARVNTLNTYYDIWSRNDMPWEQY